MRENFFFGFLKKFKIILEAFKTPRNAWNSWIKFSWINEKSEILEFRQIPAEIRPRKWKLSWPDGPVGVSCLLVCPLFVPHTLSPSTTNFMSYCKRIVVWRSLTPRLWLEFSWRDTVGKRPAPLNFSRCFSTLFCIFIAIRRRFGVQSLENSCVAIARLLVRANSSKNQWNS